MTTDDLLACATTFFEWLEFQRMLTANPLKYVKRVDTRGKLQYRRGLSQDEIRNLLSTVPHHRAVIYLTAIYTHDIAAAIAANFETKPNPKIDQMILERHSRILADVPNLKRRVQFRERFKDTRPNPE